MSGYLASVALMTFNKISANSSILWEIPIPMNEICSSAAPALHFVQSLQHVVELLLVHVVVRGIARPATSLHRR
jgi:hypothetical protein